MSAPTETWRIAGESLVTCNCDWGCPCQFNALPTHGRCEALAGFQIHEGRFGQTILDGARFARVYWWPGPIHEANGIRQLVIDEAATAEQAEAIAAVASGANGGSYFEIYASVCPESLPTVTARIELEIDRERRVGTLRVPGTGETVVKPITNPVTGEELRARIDLPSGFEYTVAEMANAERLTVRASDRVAFEHENVYAQLNAFDWSNT